MGSLGRSTLPAAPLARRCAARLGGVVVCVAVAACGMSGDPPEECIEITSPLYLDALPATHAVHIEFEGAPPDVDPVPQSQQWEEGWILASPGGGLWLGYSPPVGTEATGLTLAVNETATEETVFGSLARSSYAAALRGLEGNGPLERAALACAVGTDG